jgi:hypothetical protein
MPPDSRRHHRPAVPSEDLRAAFLAEEVERLIGQQLDVNDQLGLVEIDLPAARFLDPPPTSRSI